MKTGKSGPARKSTFFRSFAVVVSISLYFLLVWLTVRPVAAWYEVGKGGEKGLIRAEKWDGGNAVYPYLLGRYYAMNVERPDPPRAISYYRQSVALNPLQAGAWLGLSRSFLHIGKIPDAEYALERAALLNSNAPDVMWEASNFWLMNGKVGKAVADLRKFILLDPEGQLPVYDLCRKLKLNNAYVIRNLLPHHYNYEKVYLEYLISARMTDDAEEIWKLIDKNRLDEDTFIKYINFLINCGLYGRAERDWSEVEVRSGDVKSGTASLIWNPSFEKGITDGGLGWIVGRAAGVSPFIDDSVHVTGNRSLGVTFTGKNPNVAIARQVVMVKPGTKYRLQAYVRTESLTTTNGIFLAVTGLRCEGLNRSSDPVSGTNFWRTVNVDFDVPQGCSAAVIRIARNRSDKLDNRITGTAWIDSVSLRELDGTATTASRKP